MDFGKRMWESREYYRGCAILSDMVQQDIINIECYKYIEQFLSDKYHPLFRYVEPYEMNALYLSEESNDER